MKQKQLSLLAIFAIAFLALLLAGQYFFTPPPTKSAVIIQENYDYKMQNDPVKGDPNAAHHYYTLVLSWSPAFCQSQTERYGKNLPASSQYQCDAKQKFGWVIHGLWPQNEKARQISDHPRFCKGDLPMVEQHIIERYLDESPSAHLLQGEWEKHGACAFDQPNDYFAKQQALFRALKLPNQLLKSGEMFSWMRKNNPHLRNVYMGFSHNELFICYDLAWNPIDCPRNRIGY